MVCCYIRVSTIEQSEARQTEALKGKGVEKWFIEKVSGKDTNRPKFQKMMDFVRDGDILYVTEWSRLSRSTRDLIKTVTDLSDKGVTLISLKEGTCDMRTPTGRLMMGMFALLAEFERASIKEKQREGIDLAKTEGKYKGRKPKVQDQEYLSNLVMLINTKQITVTDACKELKVSRPTMYKYIRKYSSVEEVN